MVSNAFSGFDPNTKPPPVCKSAKPPLDPIPPGTTPSQLTAYVTWVDLDPLGPYYIWAIVVLDLDASPYAFTGQSEQTNKAITVQLTYDPDTLLATVSLTVTGTARPPPGETFSWHNVPIQLSPILDTGFLYDYHIPLVDYRETQIIQQAWQSV